MDLQTIALALGGEVYGRQILAPGPGHSPRDRSLSVRPNPRAPGHLLVHSFANDDWRACRDHVRDRLGLAQGAGTLHHEAPGPSSPPADTAARTANALWLWGEARDPRSTRVEAYLQHRGLILPEEAAGTAIRYDNAHPFAGQRTSAMVALVRDIRTNTRKAIHRTAISWSGNWKVHGKDRLALGPIAGGAVKLTPDEDVTTCLGIGEGIESTLSLRLVPEFGPSPVWSLLTASGVAHFPVLSGIECLWIAVDHDEAGLRARPAYSSVLSNACDLAHFEPALWRIEPQRSARVSAPFKSSAD